MNDEQKVVVVDFKMSFGSMVVFMIKWVLAAIPAFIILAFFWSVFSGVITGFLG